MSARCENWAGGEQCAARATHQVRVKLADGMAGESELCPACFAIFDAEMRKRGVDPTQVGTEP